MYVCKYVLYIIGRFGNEHFLVEEKSVVIKKEDGCSYSNINIDDRVVGVRDYGYLKGVYGGEKVNGYVDIMKSIIEY